MHDERDEKFHTEKWLTLELSDKFIYISVIHEP